jgi:hypothetical protein
MASLQAGPGGWLSAIDIALRSIYNVVADEVSSPTNYNVRR